MDLKKNIELWVENNYPQIHWTPCDMPEVIEHIKVTSDTILASAGSYVVFTDDGNRHLGSFREYYKGVWRWRSRYTDKEHRYIDDNRVVAFIETI